MLINAKTLKGYKLLSTDGEIGKVKEFYFDDLHWKIRYMLAETGNWFAGRKVLISAESLVDVRQNAQEIAVKLTQKQIEDSPSIDTDKPVSRQLEAPLYEHYNLPVFLEEPFIAGMLNSSVVENLEMTNQGGKSLDPHLRSTKNVRGYNIFAMDGEIGRIEDFVIDDMDWTIRYLLIDLNDKKQSDKVVVSTKWIDRISWDESKVFVHLFTDAIQASPKFTNEAALTRDYENELHQYYHCEGYWACESDGHVMSNYN